MKRLPYIIALALTLGIVTGCKTTEKNYREAYEKVIEKKKADALKNADIDSMAQGKIMTSGIPRKRIVGTDTINTVVEYVRRTDDHVNDSAPALQRYCVVVGRFKQLFNGRKLTERMQNAGYDALLVNNNRLDYFVVAGTSSMAVDAVELMKQLPNDKNITLMEGYPYILEPAQLAR